MDLAATLPLEAVALLSDAERLLDKTAALFLARRSTTISVDLRTRRAIPSGLEDFVESVMLKNELGRLETAEAAPCSTASLALALNCEYLIYKLYATTPIRVHPFLSHWVETLRRFDVDGNVTPTATDAVTTSSSKTIGWPQVHAARCELIKTILTCDSFPKAISTSSPQALVSHFIECPIRPFSIKPFVRILVEEGVYEPALLQFYENDASTLASTTSTAANSGSISAVGAAEWNPTTAFTRTLLTRLEASPATTVPILTHLPIDLPSLDLLTNLLQNGTLIALSVDPAPVIRNYIQHGLRQLEGTDPETGLSTAEFYNHPGSSAFASSSSSSSSGTRPSGGGTDYTPMPYEDHDGAIGTIGSGSSTLPLDRGGQIRAVKLLVLFLTNLIRKALLPPEEVYFEIQEICIRFIWIKEVREFRAFIEGG